MLNVRIWSTPAAAAPKPRRERQDRPSSSPLKSALSAAVPACTRKGWTARSAANLVHLSIPVTIVMSPFRLNLHFHQFVGDLPAGLRDLREELLHVDFGHPAVRLLVQP